MANYITIVRGDTLSRLATRHRTTVAELMRLNPQIRDPNRIFAGERLRLPGVAPAPAPVRPAPAPAPAPAIPPGTTAEERRGWMDDFIAGQRPATPPGLPPEVVAWRDARAAAAAPGVGGVFAGIGGQIKGFFDGFAGFFERLGWSPWIAELLVIGIFLTALGKVLKLRLSL